MNKLSKDIVVSVLFAFLNVLFNFWLIKEAESALSLVHLGLFLYIRRIAPTFSNITQLGTSQALIRYTSIDKNDDEKLKVYYLIAISIWAIMAFILLIIYLLFGHSLSSYFFPGNSSMLSLNSLTVTFIYISILHLSYIIGPFFLNLRKIVTYNIIQLLIASLIILIIFKSKTIGTSFIEVYYFSFIFIFILLVCLLVFIVIKLKLYNCPNRKIIIDEGKKFIKYGLPRAMITFLDMFLLTLGAMMIQNEKSLIGAFLIGITLSRTILIVLQPISLLSAVITGHKNNEEQHKKIVNLLVGGTIYLSILATTLLYNWIDVLLPYWLNNNHIINQVLFVFKLLSFGLVPYAIFQALKGVIEIKFFKPYNLYSLLIAIVLHIFIFFIFKNFTDIITALSISLMMSFTVLGVCSLYWNRKFLKSHNYFNFVYLLFINGLLFLFNFGIHHYLPNILGFVLGGMLSGVIFLIFIWKFKSNFITDALTLFIKK